MCLVAIKTSSNNKYVLCRSGLCLHERRRQWLCRKSTFADLFEFSFILTSLPFKKCPKVIGNLNQLMDTNVSKMVVWSNQWLMYGMNKSRIKRMKIGIGILLFSQKTKRGLLIMDSNIYDLTVIYLYATI